MFTQPRRRRRDNNNNNANNTKSALFDDKDSFVRYALEVNTPSSSDRATMLASPTAAMALSRRSPSMDSLPVSALDRQQWRQSDWDVWGQVCLWL